MNSVNQIGLLGAKAAGALMAPAERPVKSINDLAADREAQARQVLRHASLTKMLRSQGIRRSLTNRCQCGKTISAGKDLCYSCMQREPGAKRQDAEILAVPCTAGAS